MANERKPGSGATKDRPKRRRPARGRKPFNEPRWTVALWDSTCGQCGEVIPKGDDCYYVPAGTYEGAKQRVYCETPGCGPAQEWYVDQQTDRD